MGKIVVNTGISENLGTSTFSLSLCENLSSLLDKKCLLLTSIDTYERLTGETSVKHSFNVVMNYAISEKNLKEVINGNVENFNNSKIEILFSKNNEIFEDEQYVNFILSATKIYDFIIFDLPTNMIPKIIIDYCDSLFLVVNQDLKILNAVKNKHWSLLENVKTNIVVSKYEKSTLPISYINNMFDKKCFKLSYDKKIISLLNKMNINFLETEYKDDISAISNDLLIKYGILKKNKWYEVLYKRGGKNNVGSTK